MPDKAGVKWEDTKDGKLKESLIDKEEMDLSNHYLFHPGDGDDKVDYSYPVVDKDMNLRRGNVEAAFLVGPSGEGVTKEDLHNKLRMLNEEFEDPPIPQEDLQAEIAEKMADNELEAEAIRDRLNAGMDVSKKGKSVFIAEEMENEVEEAEEKQNHVLLAGTMMDTQFNANFWRASEDVLKQNVKQIDGSQPVKVQHSDSDWDIIGEVERATMDQKALYYIAKITDSEAVRKFKEGTWDAEKLGVSPGMDMSTVTANCTLCGETIFKEGQHVEQSDHQHMKGFEYDGQTAKLVIKNGLVGELSITSNPAYGGEEVGSIGDMDIKADQIERNYLKAQKEMDVEAAEDTVEYEYASGDKVKWDDGNAMGSVRDRTKDSCYDAAIDGDVKVCGEQSNPAYLIEIFDDDEGEMTGTMVAHKQDSLTSADFDATLVVDAEWYDEAFIAAVEDVDTTPTDEVAEKASRVLEAIDNPDHDNDECGTRVGLERANQLKNQEELSADTIGRMVNFFARHDGNQEVEGDEKWEDCGYVAWQLWGGDPGRDWAERKMKQIEEEQEGEIADDKINISGEYHMTEDEKTPEAEGGEDPSEPEENPDNQGGSPEDEGKNDPEGQAESNASDSSMDQKVAERLDELEEKLEAKEEETKELQNRLEAQKEEERREKLRKFVADDDIVEEIVADVESDEQFESELQRIKKLTSERKGSSPKKKQEAEDSKVDEALEAEAGMDRQEMVDSIIAESDYGNPEQKTEVSN